MHSRQNLTRAGVLFVAALVVATCSTPGSEIGETITGVPNGSLVTLAFAWPDGMKARVTADFETILVPEGAEETRVSAHIVYDLTVRETPGGLLISGSNLEFSADTGGSITHLGNFANQAVDFLYDFVVDRGGVFVGPGVGFDVQNEERGAAIAAAYATQPVAEDEQTGLWMTNSESEVLGSAMTRWRRTVENWAGMVFEKGEVLQADDAVPSWQVSDRLNPASHTFRFVGMVPCRQGDAVAECVQIEEVHAIAPELAAEWLGGHLKSLSDGSDGDGAAYRIEEASIVTTFVLVTRPDTLVPVRIEMQTTTTLVYTAWGRRLGSKLVERLVETYTY